MSIGRYSRDIIRAIDDDNYEKHLDSKPRGANNNKDGRAFELAFGTHVVLLEIASILAYGGDHPITVRTLGHAAFNDRPISLVDDFHLAGFWFETYSQLKHGMFRWPEIVRDFKRQIAIDRAHGLPMEYLLVLGAPRKIDRIQQRLDVRGLEEVKAKQFDFPPQYLRRIDANRDTGQALAKITGVLYPQWQEAAYQAVLAEIDQSRGETSMTFLVRTLHEKNPHLFHPLEEIHSYDFLIELLKDAAPDVRADICGPTLKLSQGEVRSAFTIPWGLDDNVEALANELKEFNEGSNEECLSLADIETMLKSNGWQRALPRTRSRPYAEERP